MQRLRSRKKLRLAVFPGYIFVRSRADEREQLDDAAGVCGLMFAVKVPATSSRRAFDVLRMVMRASLLKGRAKHDRKA